MDPLQSLITNAPDWVKRLDELNQQVEQRQLDLAKFDEIHSQSSARSIRNKGSTESLKPKDDGPAHSPQEPTPQPTRTPPRSAIQPPPRQNPPSPESNGRTPSFIQRQTNEIAACAQKRARAVLRKRQKTESMVSGEGLTTTYRSRSMIIVYYDSYVQSFFEELVKFVSAQRNLMRKAKMAAKVAEIKRLAELEMPDDDDEDGDDDPLQPGDTLIAADPKLAARGPGGTRMDDTQLRYLSTRLMGPTLRASNGLMPVRPPNSGMGLDALGRGLNTLDSGPGDIFDELDRGLEFVQGMCERAAHQFLRDGDCAEEIEKIKRRLEQTKEGAGKELDRLAKESPNGSTKEPEPPKFRSYRPSTMRRDPGASASSKKKNRVEVDDDEGVQDI